MSTSTSSSELPALSSLSLKDKITTTVTSVPTATILFDSSSTSLQSPPNPVFNDENTASVFKKASELINSDQLVSFASESVYGLGANALSSTAISKIYSTKGRPSDNPLIVHISSLDMLEKDILPADYEMSPIYKFLIDKFWPGPMTLLFPASKSLPTEVTANLPTVAVRFPSHPVARALIATSGKPIAAPSANRSGRPSPTKASHVFTDLDGRIELILDGGDCEGGLESTVIDGLSTAGELKILRPGCVTPEGIEEALSKSTDSSVAEIKVTVYARDYQDSELATKPTTPGMKYTHYTPSIPVFLLVPCIGPRSWDLPAPIDIMKSLLQEINEEATAEAAAKISPEEADSIFAPPPPTPIYKQKIGLMLYTSSKLSSFLPPSSQFVHHPLGPLETPSVAAQRLFDGLLTLEAAGCVAVFIEAGEEKGEGLAVAERVRKASKASFMVCCE